MGRLQGLWLGLGAWGLALSLHCPRPQFPPLEVSHSL